MKKNLTKQLTAYRLFLRCTIRDSNPNTTDIQEDMIFITLNLLDMRNVCS